MGGFDELDLEKLGQVEQDGEGDHGGHVGPEDPPPGVSEAVDVVVVFDRPPNCPISLQSEDDRRVCGAAHDHVVELVQEVTEQILVNLRRPYVLSHPVQKRTNDKDVVENGETREEPKIKSNPEYKQIIHMLAESKTSRFMKKAAL